MRKFEFLGKEYLLTEKGVKCLRAFISCIENITILGKLCIVIGLLCMGASSCEESAKNQLIRQYPEEIQETLRDHPELLKNGD